MKKVFFTIFAIFAMVWMMSCDNKKGKNNETVSDGGDVLSYETIVIERNDDARNIKFKVSVDFPTNGPKELTDAITRNIGVKMGGDSTEISKDDLNGIAEEFVSECAEEISEFQESTDNNVSVSYSLEGKIKLEANTEKYVTYCYDTYLYKGGAHGMPSKGYFTIAKDCNEVIGIEDVFVPGFEDEIKDIIKKKLVEQYYREDHSWDDMFPFALPVQEPGITADGLVICYGAYEIDCYAAGMPFCTIPFDEIDNMLTERVRNLIR